MAIPTCKACGKPHYNFKPCDEAAAEAVQRAPRRIFRERDDQYYEHAPGVFVRRRFPQEVNT